MGFDAVEVVNNEFGMGNLRHLLPPYVGLSAKHAWHLTVTCRLLSMLKGAAQITPVVVFRISAQDRFQWLLTCTACESARRVCDVHVIQISVSISHHITKSILVQ